MKERMKERRNRGRERKETPQTRRPSLNKIYPSVMLLGVQVDFDDDPDQIRRCLSVSLEPNE